MRIAFVNSAWPASWGGGEKWTVDAAEWFRKRGDDVTVIGRPQSRLIGAALSRAISVREYRFGGDFDPVAIFAAGRLLKDCRAQLAVVNFNKEAWQFGLAARTLKIPVVARHGFPLLHNSLHHRRLVSKLLSRLVVNAQSIRDNYARIGFDVSAVSVIHNGVRTVPLRTGEMRGRFQISPDEPLVVAAGRLESQKRFDRVIDIAQALLPDYPKMTILIAGEGPLHAGLQADVKARGLRAGVLFAGFLPDLAEIVGDADLFLLTSDNEGTPNVLLEAMAAGVACVAFGVGAVPEILAGALEENVIRPGDTAAMAARAGQLLGNDALRRGVAARMQTRVEQEFTLEHSMSRFADLFDHTVRTRP